MENEAVVVLVIYFWGVLFMVRLAQVPVKPTMTRGRPACTVVCQHTLPVFQLESRWLGKMGRLMCFFLRNLDRGDVCPRVQWRVVAVG